MSTSVKFNGVNLSELFAVSELSRPLPEFRPESTEINGADGESFDALTYGLREVSFVLTAAVSKSKTSQDVQKLARTLADVLAVREPKRLVISDEKSRKGEQLYRKAVPTGAFDADEFIRAGRWQCRFVQHDPYLYVSGDPGKHHLNANTLTHVKIGGNVPTWLTVKATPSSGSSEFYIKTTDDIVRFRAPFDGQSVLTLDFEQCRASLSPSIANAEGLQTNSTFFTVGGTETMDGNAESIALRASHSCDLSWQERWL